MRVTHESIPPFIPSGAKYLILGSLPSVKSREVGFYYGHKKNRFFAVLSAIFAENEPLSIEERKAFLIEHKIALYDVVYECDIDSSDDASIKNVKVIDIEKILNECPTIKCVAINGGKAKELFNKYLKEKVVDKDVDIVYCSSTSPRNARIKLDSLIEQYSKIFIEK